MKISQAGRRPVIDSNTVLDDPARRERDEPFQRERRPHAVRVQDRRPDMNRVVGRRGSWPGSWNIAYYSFVEATEDYFTVVIHVIHILDI